MSALHPDVTADAEATLVPGPDAASQDLRPSALRPSVLRRVSRWEWVLLLTFGLVWLAVAGPRALARTDCRSEPFPLRFGTDTGASMTVKAGSRCAIAARTANAMISHFEIDAQPAHGQLLRRGRTGVTYSPSRNYRGEDAFGFVLVGASPSSRGTAIVRVRVLVE